MHDRILCDSQIIGMESRHELRKQKKKLQKRKRIMSSSKNGVTFVSKRAPGKVQNDDDDENDSGDETFTSLAENRDIKLVQSASTHNPALDHDDDASKSTGPTRPIFAFLEGKESRPPAEVLAWMIAPITLQQFFEFVLTHQSQLLFSIHFLHRSMQV